MPFVSVFPLTYFAVTDTRLSCICCQFLQLLHSQSPTSGCHLSAVSFFSYFFRSYRHPVVISLLSVSAVTSFKVTETRLSSLCCQCLQLLHSKSPTLGCHLSAVSVSSYFIQSHRHSVVFSLLSVSPVTSFKVTDTRLSSLCCQCLQLLHSKSPTLGCISPAESVSYVWNQ